MDKELIYEKLPADIAERHVLLMDPILATGNSAVRAIQVGMVLTWTSQHKERASPMPAEEPCTQPTEPKGLQCRMLAESVVLSAGGALQRRG